jgi:hypothetical protein
MTNTTRENSNVINKNIFHPVDASATTSTPDSMKPPVESV